MSEPKDDITDEPKPSRPRDVTNEPGQGEGEGDYPPDADRPAIPSVVKKTAIGMGAGAIALIVLGIGAVLLLSCGCLALGLMIPAVAKVRDAAARSQSQNNLRQMGTAINNVASNSTTGDIPPAVGYFPNGSKTQLSFFAYLLPYIEAGNGITSIAGAMANSTAPIKTYVAPADPFNQGTNSLCSYSCNAVLLGVYTDPATATCPRLPNSFGGRTSQVIVCFERSPITNGTGNATPSTTATGGAYWSSTATTVGATSIHLGTAITAANSVALPDFGPKEKWTYNTPHAFTSAGCIVMMGDGSARTVTQGNAGGTLRPGPKSNDPAETTAWSWAIDPNNTSPQPSNW